MVVAETFSMEGNNPSLNNMFWGLGFRRFFPLFEVYFISLQLAKGFRTS